MSTWTIIQHVPWEGPGWIERVGSRRGITFDIRKMFQGDSLPRPDQPAGLIVMGGPMGVGDTDRYPHLKEEKELINGVFRRQSPILGVCLGSQLLAAALGARVHRGPSEEIGFGQVTLTAAGMADPVLGPAGSPLPVFHWHGDTFEIPPGAEHLAGSDLFENQAFRAGSSAYGFQFHVEVDRDLAGEWAGRLPAGLQLDEPSRQKVEERGIAILERFFEASG